MRPGFIEGAQAIPGESQIEYEGLPVRAEIVDLGHGKQIPVLASVWIPSREEINALRKGGSVILRCGGTVQVPVILGVLRTNGEEVET
jgi:hypothetical protein